MKKFDMNKSCSLCIGGTLLLIQTVKSLWGSFVTKPELLFSTVNFSLFLVEELSGATIKSSKYFGMGTLLFKKLMNPLS